MNQLHGSRLAGLTSPSLLLNTHFTFALQPREFPNSGHDVVVAGTEYIDHILGSRLAFRNLLVAADEASITEIAPDAAGNLHANVSATWKRNNLSSKEASCLVLRSIETPKYVKNRYEMFSSGLQFSTMLDSEVVDCVAGTCNRLFVKRAMDCCKESNKVLTADAPLDNKSIAALWGQFDLNIHEPSALLMSEVSLDDWCKYVIAEIGGELGEEVKRQGWKHDRILGRKLVLVDSESIDVYGDGGDLIEKRVLSFIAPEKLGVYFTMDSSLWFHLSMNEFMFKYTALQGWEIFHPDGVVAISFPVK